LWIAVKPPKRLSQGNECIQKKENDFDRYLQVVSSIHTTTKAPCLLISLSLNPLSPSLSRGPEGAQLQQAQTHCNTLHNLQQTLQHTLQHTLKNQKLTATPLQHTMQHAHCNTQRKKNLPATYAATHNARYTAATHTHCKK